MIIEILMTILPSPEWLLVWYLVGVIITYHIVLFTYNDKEELFFSPMFCAVFWPIGLMGQFVSLLAKPIVFVFGKYETFLLSIKHKKGVERR